MMSSHKPTTEFYSLFQEAYDLFNKELFNDELSNCLITVNREKRTMGYFSPERWTKSSGDITHEISLNPSYFAKYKFIEIFQTLVHEMCHLWQYNKGTAPRKCYHDKEWAEKMERIGLIPSDTGYPGGKKTGQKMADYPDPNGKFLTISKKFIQQHLEQIWIDRFPVHSTPAQIRPHEPQEPFEHGTNEFSNDVLFSYTVSELMGDKLDQETLAAANDSESDLAMVAKAKSKLKYTCPECNTNIWGKPNLKIECVPCRVLFDPVY